MKKYPWILTAMAILMLSQFSIALAQIEDDEFPGEIVDENCIPENLVTPYDSYKDSTVDETDIKKWYSFGSEYYKNKNYESALPYLWKVFINDTGKYAVLAIRKIAYSYFSLQIVDSTLIACYKGLARYPNHDNLHYYAGYLQDNLGKFRCAIPHYEHLVDAEPEEKSYLEKLAFLYFKDENERSIEIQQRLIDLDPNNSEYHATMAAYQTHFYGDALEARKQAYVNNPENIELAFMYGKEAYDQGKYKESIDPLSAVLAKNTKHVDAYKYRAMSLEGLGQYNAAIADYKKILEVQEDNADIMCNIATDYKNLNQFSNGMYWIGRALQARPGFGLAYITKAEIYEASVSYCQNTEKRGRKYDDGLVYQLAYDAYEMAAKDPAFKSDANKRKSNLQPVLPTQEEKFMNQNRTTLRLECYTSWIK
jgi:tetratricopeptide (TPR) repeat protein